MNSIKTVFVLAVLGAIGYGVYVSINNKRQIAPPSGVDGSWSEPLNIQIPQVGSTAPQFPSTLPGPAAAVGGLAPGPAGQITGIAPPLPYASGPAATSGQAGSLPQPFPPEGYPSTQSSLPQVPDGAAVAASVAPDTTNALPGPGGLAAHQPGPSFEALMETAQKQLDEGALAKALETLSQVCGDPALTIQQNRRLTHLLDQVAGTVIYSRQHLLERPYKVRLGETLDQIAGSCRVPAGLLAKINGIRDPNNLRAGQELKVVRGPFGAVIDLNRHELTLELKGQYAGRFRIGIGHQLYQAEGEYVVKDKTPSPASPTLGSRWLGLSKQSGDPGGPDVGIHGSDNPRDIGCVTATGSISLGDRDIEDVYDILSIGSRVVIRR